jgi:hypothetical protein
MEFLGTKWDIISGGQIRWKLWGKYAISVLDIAPYTGVKLKSPSSGIMILDCHISIYRV